MRSALFRFFHFRKRGRRAGVVRAKPSHDPEAYSDALFASWVQPPPEGGAQAAAQEPAAEETQDIGTVVDRFYRSQQ